MKDEQILLLNIQQLIDRNAASVDGFFTDSKAAASEIVKFLKNENLIKPALNAK